MSDLRDKLIQIFHFGLQAFARGDEESLQQVITDLNQLASDLENFVSEISAPVEVAPEPEQPGSKKKKSSNDG